MIKCMQGVEFLMIIDTHIHADGMCLNDFEAMVRHGIKKAITCAYYPTVPRFQQTMSDLFNKLIHFDVERSKSMGLELFVAIGIHPRSIPVTGCNKVMKKISDLIKNPSVVALGEIGLEFGTQKEIKIFKRQVNLATEHQVPIIVHTPRKEKAKITKKIIKILKKAEIDPELVIIDHVSRENIDLVKNEDFTIGFTIQWGKLTVEEGADLILENPEKRIVINTDSGFRKYDPTLLAKLVKTLEERNASRDLIEDVTHRNAEEIFFRETTKHYALEARLRRS